VSGAPFKSRMVGSDLEMPPCVGASSVFKRRGRWYARVACPLCANALRVRLSLGPMVARCADCRKNVEADVSPVVRSGWA
jgi:hypothetical protein